MVTRQNYPVKLGHILLGIVLVIVMGSPKRSTAWHTATDSLLQQVGGRQH